MQPNQLLFEALLNGKRAATDSRKIGCGDVFFALKGQKVNAEDYLKEVSQKGALGAIVSEDFQGSDHGLIIVKVQNPLKTLQEFAKKIHQRRKTKVIGVTGSVGKTSTKDFIAHLLSKKFRVSKTLGNANSQVGLPLTLINDIKENDDWAVLEMGMSCSGQIANLVQIAPPNLAVITSVALVHAANFSSIEGIASAKGEITSHIETQKLYLGEKCHAFQFNHPSIKKCFAIECLGGEHLPQHFKENLACAQAIARDLEMTNQEILEQTATLELPVFRFQVSFKKGVHFINDSYNACTVSMLAALNAIPKPNPESKTIAVLGEMLELGIFSEESHTQVAIAALNKIDHLFLIGKGCEPIRKLFEQRGLPVKLYEQTLDVVDDLKAVAKSGDVILLKGSAFWQIHQLEELF